ncbi:MAG: Uma2 family endonuclease [Rhizobacter sp.]|nr:Uma2 family endonuclease [Chlorobiales bacterium]
MDTTAIALNLASVVSLTDDQLYQLCLANKGLRIERTSTGQILIAMPTAGKTSVLNFEICGQLYRWNKQAQLGVAFDSSGGFTLPNGAMRSPDAAWLPLERWNGLSEKEQEQFPPLCPDFVIELLSKTDALRTAQEKMAEWMTNGCRLAWLINPKDETVFIYRQGQATQTVQGFETLLSGEDVLPEFSFALTDLR